MRERDSAAQEDVREWRSLAGAHDRVRVRGALFEVLVRDEFDVTFERFSRRLQHAGFASVISAAARAPSTTISLTTARNAVSNLGTP